MKHKVLQYFLFIFLFLALVNLAEAETKFLKIERDKDNVPRTLDTSIVSYNKSIGGVPVQVDLISAIHIGEKSYYESLNKDFQNYDALLFELIIPEGQNVENDQPSGTSLISMLQKTLKDTLKLEFQLDGIDYRKKNFVHADMSDKQFADSMTAKGESLLQMFLKLMMQAEQFKGESGQKSMEIIMLEMLLNPKRAFSLKALLAEQLVDVEKITAIIDGPDGSTIISERNKVALGVLDREIKRGKNKLGIFYGTGHMPDMEKRLVGEMGFVKSGQRWLTAWQLQ